MSVTPNLNVATVLTVYGIETEGILPSVFLLFQELQQYLPFTVLKPALAKYIFFYNSRKLQQYLPFTVLKLTKSHYC